MISPLSAPPETVALTFSQVVRVGESRSVAMPTLELLFETTLVTEDDEAIEVDIRWTNPTVDGIELDRPPPMRVYFHDTTLVLSSSFADATAVRARVPRGGGMERMVFTRAGESAPVAPDALSELKFVLAHLTAAIAPAPPDANVGSTWVTTFDIGSGETRIAAQTVFTLAGVDGDAREIAARTTLVGSDKELSWEAKARFAAGRFLAQKGELASRSERAQPPMFGRPATDSPRMVIERVIRVISTEARINAEAMRPKPAPPPPARRALTAEQVAAFDRSIAEFTKPFGERRGIDWSDTDHGTILVKASVVEVSDVFMARGYVVHGAALGRSVRLDGTFAAVVRFAGQTWTTIAGLRFDTRVSAADIARELDVPVLALIAWEEDFEYTHFEGAEVVEKLEVRGARIRKFQSRLRRRADLPKKRPEEIASALVAEQNAYFPILEADYFFGDGRTRPKIEFGDLRTVGNPGFFLGSDGREIHFVPEIFELDILTHDR